MEGQNPVYPLILNNCSHSKPEDPAWPEGDDVLGEDDEERLGLMYYLLGYLLLILLSLMSFF